MRKPAKIESDQRPCEALEPRTLLASAPVVYQGSDIDGDQYTITLRGGGTMVVTPQPNGGIASIVLSGTTQSSSLSISLRRTNGSTGAVALGSLAGDGDESIALREFIAPAVDLIGSGINLPGGVRAIKLRDVTNGADITAGGQAGDTVDLRVRFVSNASNNQRSEFTFAGRVEQFAASAVFFLTLEAPSMGKIFITGLRSAGVRGNANSFSLNLTATDVVRSLDRVLITGTLSSGNWTLARAVDWLQFGSTGANWQISAPGQVRLIRASNTLDGTMTFGAVRTIRVGGAFSAVLNTNQPDQFPVGLLSVRALNYADGELNMADQTIGEVFGHDWADGGISALRMVSFRMVEGRGFAGGLARTEFRLSDDVGPFGLGRFVVEGVATGSTVRVDGDTRSVRIGTISAFRFFCGVQEGFEDLPSSIQDFNLTRGRIDSFVVKERFRTNFFGNPIFSVANLQLAARSIGNVILDARINFTNNNQDFGVVADRLDRIRYATSRTQSVIATNLEQPGSGLAFGTQRFLVRIV
jgi:hypothetical protein